MLSEDPESIAKLTRAFEAMGAPDRQAAVMARQLLKRADQLAAERQIEPVEALGYLLKVTESGRKGEVHPERFIHQSPEQPPE
ncbi:MAG: hypothetical protein ACFB20_03925 [Opitutales bacterium]